MQIKTPSSGAPRSLQLASTHFIGPRRPDRVHSELLQHRLSHYNKDCGTGPKVVSRTCSSEEGTVRQS